MAAFLVCKIAVSLKRSKGGIKEMQAVTNTVNNSRIIMKNLFMLKSESNERKS
jgi:uncharacterized protein YaaN involved in tellurite resistance